MVELDLDGLERALDAIAESPARTVAICFLFSFINPEHERAAVKRAQERGFAVSASHQVLPQHREFERMSTTAANAYLAPVMSRYLDQLEAALRARGTVGGESLRLRIMQSNGGSLGAASAGRNAVRTVLSGPAGGVAGAFSAAQAANFPNAMTFDMGGTSADVALCPGRLLERTDLTLDDMPLRTPAVDLHTVGAGGGSIAWFDPGGALRVGPQSAGADPGPAAYGVGDLPTVTDAHAVLGRLRPEQQLGGSVALHLDRARAAVATIAAPFNDDVAAAARAIVDVVNANMARALRVISVERGYDPANFTLVAFGGAGPLHACDLADALGIPQALIPAAPGVLSAAGMLIADITRDAEQGLHLTLGPDSSGEVEALSAAFRALAEQARAEIASDGYRVGVQVEFAADLRYLGQSHELTVPLPVLDDGAEIRSAFHAAHQERFGFATLDTPVEVVTARAKARSHGYRGILGLGTEPRETFDQHVPVIWDRERPTRVLHRSAVTERIDGPAVILQLDTITLIPPGWHAEPLEGGSILLRRTL